MRSVKRIIAFFVISLCSVGSANAFLAEAFGDMGMGSGTVTTGTDAHTFRTDSTRGVHLGSVSMRTPVKAINLVSVERASFEAGCHGMDINFGGMEFIRGSEVVEMLKIIAKGVPMMMYQMVLKAIAAPIMDAINYIYDTMQAISAALKNSCQASAAIAGALMNYTKDGDGNTLADRLGGASKEATDFVGGLAGKAGGAVKDFVMDNDFVKGIKSGVDKIAPEGSNHRCMLEALSLGFIKDTSSDKACGGARAKNTKLAEKEELIKALSKEKGWSMDQARLYYANQVGNPTWSLLQAVGIAPSKLTRGSNPDTVFNGNVAIASLFMSIMGADAYNQNATKEDEGRREKIQTNSALKPETFYYLILCGDHKGMEEGISLAKAAKVNEKTLEFTKKFCTEGAVKSYSGESNDIANAPVIMCENKGDIEDFINGCLWVKTTTLKELTSTYGSTGPGFIFQVMVALQGAVDKAKTGEEDFTDTERTIMAMAPFPLYKAINIASTDHELARQLVMSNAVVLSHGFAGAFITQSLSNLSRERGVINNIGTIEADLAKKFAEVNREIGASIQAVAVKGVVNEFAAAGERIMFHVQNMNREILKSTMAMGIGGADFADAMVTMTSH